MNVIGVFYIGKADQFKRMLEAVLADHGIRLIGQVQPDQPFDLLDGSEEADLFIADVSDPDFGFDGYEIIEMIAEVLPNKKSLP